MQPETPMWTDHLKSQVSPELDKEIIKELKDKPKDIVKEDSSVK